MKILFVCSGNTCRSPLATFLARQIAEEHGEDVASQFSFASAGTAATDGQPASEHARAVAAERAQYRTAQGAGRAAQSAGVEDLAHHASTSLTADGIRQADLVLTMTAAHRRTVERLVPAAIERTFTLKEYAALARRAMGRDGSTTREGAAGSAGGGEAEPRPGDGLPGRDIADPFGGDLERYRKVAAEIESELRDVLDWLVSQGKENAGNPRSPWRNPH